MNSSPIKLAVVLFSTVALASATVHAAPPQGVTRIIVESGRASVEVTGGASASVEAYASVDGAEQQITVRATDSSTVIVEGSAIHDGSTILRIRSPRNVSLEATGVTSGSISVSDVTGDLDLRTRSGNVTVTGGRVVNASSGSGNIRVSNASGEVDLSTASGNVEASSVGAARISAGSGNVMVDNARGAVSVNAQSGNVQAKTIKGACRINALSGNVLVDAVDGDLLAKAVSGRVAATNIDGSVRVFSASDDVSVTCASGNVEAESASGNVTIRFAGGDVDANSASGNVLLTAPLKANGRYSLKSVSGDTVFNVQGEPAGFSASLSSFSGDASSDFPLGVARGASPQPGGRRLEGTHGNGGATVTLHAFSGSARIARAATQTTTCPK